MPKTARGRLPIEPYKLNALPQTVPPREDATIYCPVKALKAYPSATADPEFVKSLTPYHLSKLLADV